MLPLLRRILSLALPSIATFSSMTLTGMVTLIMVGRLGPTAIAVVGISNILLYNAWALFAGVNESINYLISQNFGERTMDEANRRMLIALVLSVVLDVVWVTASLLLPQHILHWMGASASLTNAGSGYLRVRMFAFAFSMFTNVFFGYMRAVGDTRTPMVISLVTNALLIGLTYALTYGMGPWRGFGLVGAGWSMVITEGLGFGMSLFVHYGLYHPRFQTRHLSFWDWSQVRLIVFESVKLSLMELAMSVGMLVFTTCITRLGTVAVAANEIALNILSLGFMPANGFATAATVIVGQDIGDRRPLEARRGGLFTVAIGLMFMLLFSVFLWLFASSVARIYTNHPDVYLLSVSLIHLASFIQLFDGGGIILAGALRGIGDTNYLSVMSLVLNWALFVPLTIVLTGVAHLGQTGAWIALCTLIVLIGLCNAMRYLLKDWRFVSKSVA